MSKSVKTRKREQVGVHKASEYLAKMGRNRPVNVRQVSKYASDMAHGQWRDVGDPIRFDKHENLIDGQHRLLAIIESGTTLWMDVVRNLDAVDMLAIDTENRTLGHQLGVIGYDHGRMIGAALPLLWAWEQGNLSGRTLTKASRYEYEQLLNRHPEFIVSAEYTSVNKWRCILEPSSITYLHYLFSRKDQDMATMFFDSLRDGVGLKGNEPVYLLRERLLDARRPEVKLPSSYKMALTIKAWNFTRTGRNIQVLKFGSREKFPEVI